ncbi:MAG: hypothetical protein NTW38_06270 [Candidatus Aminicenantes bacterium]|nr:hypothetical protein [Candidatus Aminicenantes bacterium]
MNKGLRIAAGALLLAAGLFAFQRLPAGSQAIFCKSGEIIKGKIVDLVSPELDFKLENGTIIALHDVWMINFDNAEWNFPEERNILESNDHYVFLKNGDIHSGRIASFSAEDKAFVFESGETYSLVQCRRIYFSKIVPRGIR